MEGFWRLCREEDLLPPAGGKILAAVSGGADSMCLLALLLEAGEQYGFTVEAAHFDHRIRETSRRDCAFVEGWCRAHGVPIHIGGADIPALAAKERRGLRAPPGAAATPSSGRRRRTAAPSASPPPTTPRTMGRRFCSTCSGAAA